MSFKRVGVALPGLATSSPSVRPRTSLGATRSIFESSVRQPFTTFRQSAAERDTTSRRQGILLAFEDSTSDAVPPAQDGTSTSSPSAAAPLRPASTTPAALVSASSTSRNRTLEGKRTELNTALELICELNEVEAIVQQRTSRVGEAEREVEELSRKMEAAKGKLGAERADRDAAQLRLGRIRASNGFRTQEEISELSSEIERMELQERQAEKNSSTNILGAGLDASVDLSANDTQDPIGDSNCPVCYEKPKEIYCCHECHNMVCGNCKDLVHVCPMCRQDFQQQPPFRNKFAERLLQ